MATPLTAAIFKSLIRVTSWSINVMEKHICSHDAYVIYVTVFIYLNTRIYYLRNNKYL